MKRPAWLTVLGSLSAATLGAQGVLVAPHAVYIDHRVRSGAILLYNPNPVPAEITISTLYAYPVTDSLGRMLLHIVEQPDSSQPSAAGWIQAFPRRLTVAPLERQTVRLLATPPPGLADGEYWARLVISAKGGQVPIAGAADTANIRVGLTLEVRTIIGVAYRKGPVHTGVAVSRLRARVVGDSLETWLRLDRRGDAAFVGTVRGVLVDSAGAERASFFSPLGVYYSLDPRFAIHVGTLQPGRYRLRVDVTTERADLAPEVVLPAPAVRDSIDVRVP